MATILNEVPIMPRAVSFEVEAVDVLGTLRSALKSVLSSLGGIRKATDLQRKLKLDTTLSWQLFQIGATSDEQLSSLAAGAKVPSRAAIKRFLDAAAAKDVSTEKIDRAWSSFKRFEDLVEVHAGDRSSFISMVSAAAGMDSEWLAADLQHRRNAFRAMSHAIGEQALTKHKCAIYHESRDGRSWEFGTVVGYVGLRILRSLPSTVVFRIRYDNPSIRRQVQRVGLGSDPGAAGGYLLSEYCSDPLPAMNSHDSDAGWFVTEIDKPLVGNRGACTLRFASAFRGYPIPDVTATLNNPFEGSVFVDKPVEVLISDVLVKPGMMRGAQPTAKVLLGYSHSDTPGARGDALPLLGNYRVERLGIGADVLATPDIPDYSESVRATADRFGCDVSSYEAYRIRIEYPFYQSDVRFHWDLLPGSVPRE